MQRYLSPENFTSAKKLAAKMDSNDEFQRAQSRVALSDIVGRPAQASISAIAGHGCRLGKLSHQQRDADMAAARLNEGMALSSSSGPEMQAVGQQSLNYASRRTGRKARSTAQSSHPALAPAGGSESGVDATALFAKRGAPDVAGRAASAARKSATEWATVSNVTPESVGFTPAGFNRGQAIYMRPADAANCEASGASLESFPHLAVQRGASGERTA